MKNSESSNDRKRKEDAASNQSRQAVDKAPGEEKRKGEKLTEKDLKGKKVDADPSQQSDRLAK
jgi:hypothetical protein